MGQAADTDAERARAVTIGMRLADNSRDPQVSLSESLDHPEPLDEDLCVVLKRR